SPMIFLGPVPGADRNRRGDEPRPRSPPPPRTIPGDSNVTVGDIPDELEVTTANGETFTLNRTQLTHAATIIETGSSIDGDRPATAFRSR
ncbi:hypothetical protein JS562_53315, partial [Agrobacterium sp. S2]|nr:hypothetical protein [Agrobacterium sp. S2]